MPPPPNANIGYTAYIRLVPLDVVTAGGIGFAATWLAAVLPARRASRMPVVEALRQGYSPSERGETRNRICAREVPECAQFGPSNAPVRQSWRQLIESEVNLFSRTRRMPWRMLRRVLLNCY